MAITGMRFLELSSIEPVDFSINNHALMRLAHAVGRSGIDPCIALACFVSGQQLSLEEVFARGYHPNVTQYERRGIHSWYFAITLDGCDFLAVIEQGRFPGAMPFWRTTYSPDRTIITNTARPTHGQIAKADQTIKRHRLIYKSYERHKKNRKGPRREKTTDRKKRRERRDGRVRPSRAPERNTEERG